MLGWMISVYRMADEAATRRALDVLPGVPVVLDDGARGERLAVWQAGPYGLDWIRRRPVARAASPPSVTATRIDTSPAQLTFGHVAQPSSVQGTDVRVPLLGRAGRVRAATGLPWNDDCGRTRLEQVRR